MISGWATDWMLTRSSISDKAFILESASDSPVILVRSVEVVIQEEFSIVTVFTRNQPLSRLEFRFPYTERDKLEKAIAQVLGLSRSQVNQVTRYNRLK